MNWEVVMWVVLTVFMLMSALTWLKALTIPQYMWQFVDWNARTIFFMYGVPVIFIALLIGKLW